MADLPSGTVTFVFTDLEGSTRLWEEHPDAMGRALARHDEILRGAFESNDGVVFATMGDGMAAAFASAREALSAVLEAQVGLGSERWGETGALRARIGVHSDEGVLVGGQYLNRPLNRCARLMSIAHGGQIVLSSATAALVAGELPAAAGLVDLGEHRLRDLARPMRVFQLTHPGLAVEFPPLRSVDFFPGNLPVVLTSFVGREREFESLVAALGQARLVTVIGPGGVGKTRLAVQVAAEALPAYEDGAWFCELAPVTDRDAVAEAIAACLDAPQQPGASATTSLLAFLRHKEMLLVLDNCEHLIDAVGSLGESITHSCPKVTVLATSREALGVDGETLRPLGSLVVPHPAASQVDVMTAASVRLFAERAQAVRPDFVVDAANASAVAEICRQLDGVPLALELASARVASLSVNEIARRLDQRFRLLTGGRRTALERHQTLRATVDWSYDLLGDTDASVFNRLSVFMGGFQLDAAEAVVSGDGVDPDEVVDALSRLVARSMVVADESDGEMRYRLLETMRQYAREHLDAAGESDATRRHHAEHYVTLVEAAAVGVKGRDETHWVQVLDTESANVTAALDWAIASSEADLALRIAIALSARPGPSLGSTLARVAAMPAARHHPLRPHAMVWPIGLVHSGDLAVATEQVRQMDLAFNDAGIALTAVAHHAHAALASLNADMSALAIHGKAAVEVALREGDRYRAAWNGASVAMFLASSGESDEAVQLAEHAHAIGLELENPTLLAVSDIAAGYVLSTVNPAAAIPRLESGVTVLRALGNETLRFNGERCLARLLAANGELVRAFEIYETVLELTITVGWVTQTRLTIESVGVSLVAGGYGDDAAAIIFGALEANIGLYRGDNPVIGRGEAVETLRRTMGHARYEKAASRGRAYNGDDLTEFARATLARTLADLNIH